MLLNTHYLLPRPRPPPVAARQPHSRNLIVSLPKTFGNNANKTQLNAGKSSRRALLTPLLLLLIKKLLLPFLPPSLGFLLPLWHKEKWQKTAKDMEILYRPPPPSLSPSVRRSEMLSLFTQKQSYATLYEARHVVRALALVSSLSTMLEEHQKQKISPQTA